MKNNNFRCSLNLWIKTTNKLALALNNCYIIIFQKINRNEMAKLKKNFKNVKFEPIPVVIKLIPN